MSRRKSLGQCQVEGLDGNSRDVMVIIILTRVVAVTVNFVIGSQSIIIRIGIVFRINIRLIVSVFIRRATDLSEVINLKARRQQWAGQGQEDINRSGCSGSKTASRKFTVSNRKRGCGETANYSPSKGRIIIRSVTGHCFERKLRGWVVRYYNVISRNVTLVDHRDRVGNCITWFNGHILHRGKHLDQRKVETKYRYRYIVNVIFVLIGIEVIIRC